MITYSTTIQVRKEAGFFGNPGIIDDDIDTLRKQSYNIVRGIISGMYSIQHMVPGDILFDGSQAAGILERAEILIAAGYLLSREYGPEQMGEDYDAERSIAAGKALLMAIYDKKAPTRLIDVNGSEFGTVSIASNSGEDGIVMTMTPSCQFFGVNQRF